MNMQLMPAMLTSKPKIFEEVQSLPQMTANSVPTGHVATASDWNSSATEPWEAFDQIIAADSAWRTSLNTTTGWVQRTVPDAIEVWKYRVSSGGVVAAAPRAFSLQYWNGSSFSDADSRSGITGWSSLQTREFVLGAPIISDIWRLNVTQNDGGNYVMVAELELLQVLS